MLIFWCLYMWALCIPVRYLKSTFIFQFTAQNIKKICTQTWHSPDVMHFLFSEYLSAKELWPCAVDNQIRSSMLSSLWILCVYCRTHENLNGFPLIHIWWVTIIFSFWHYFCFLLLSEDAMIITTVMLRLNCTCSFALPTRYLLYSDKAWEKKNKIKGCFTVWWWQLTFYLILRLKKPYLMAKSSMCIVRPRRILLSVDRRISTRLWQLLTVLLRKRIMFPMELFFGTQFGHRMAWKFCNLKLTHHVSNLKRMFAFDKISRGTFHSKQNELVIL